MMDATTTLTRTDPQPGRLTGMNGSKNPGRSVERGLRCPDLAIDLLNRGSGVGLVQRKRDLLLGELALLNGELSFVEFAGIL
jgi:hypothetical protein